VGHSVVNDSLQTTILLSHLAPYLETIKWFHEKNRPGYVEANATGWQKVSDWLPHMQGMRLMERARAVHFATQKPETREQSIDATVTRITVDKSLQAKPRLVQRFVQVTPKLVDRSTEAKPELISMSIDATPSIMDTSVDATPAVSHQSVSIRPNMVSTEVDASVHTETKAISAIQALPFEDSNSVNRYPDPFYALPSVIPTVLAGLLTFACRILSPYSMLNQKKGTVRPQKNTNSGLLLRTRFHHRRQSSWIMIFLLFVYEFLIATGRFTHFVHGAGAYY
jgi:hypothetical protein